jgi:hypothetical protein
MFRTYAESRGLDTPRTFTAALSEFRQESDSWFDGSPGSVDRRLSKCAKLLHQAETAAAGDPASQLTVIAELSADRTALKELRADLLSGANTRDPGYIPPRIAALTDRERRWVTLESAKFFADNEDAQRHTAEIAERARRHAEIATSASPRSRVLTAAFEAAVAGHSRALPTLRVARRKRPVFTGFHDSQMFL